MKEIISITLTSMHVLAGTRKYPIYFRNIQVVGDAKNRKKVRQATKWVDDHMDELLEEWKRILAAQ